MARGIEGTPIFRSDRDREDFLRRLEAQVAAAGCQVLAWALLPNHLHLLIRTGARPLASMMRRLLAGYATAFNRRHRRRGHLFQNRYKSIVVEEDPYLLELTRYIHLNPLRAGVVRDLAALDRYPWAGHSALLGRARRPWQAVDEVLREHHRRVGEARRRYRDFIAAGVTRGRRPDLQGGGLRRSAGGWEALAALRRGRERWASDERILGSGPFVDRTLREAAPPPAPSQAAAWRALPALIELLAKVAGATASEVTGGSRRRPAAQGRAMVAAAAVTGLGLPASRVAGVLGVTPVAAFQSIARGLEALRARGLDPTRLGKETMEKV